MRHRTIVDVTCYKTRNCSLCSLEPTIFSLLIEGHCFYRICIHTPMFSRSHVLLHIEITNSLNLVSHKEKHA